MAHSLRKYLSNRGSALFMVISTMTALMIACMAMYFSVISARTTQFATFFREQSYQSAVSLNDMVLAGLMDGTLTSGDKDLLSTLSDMKEGETITTGASGFSSFDSTLSGSDIAQMGAYSMDITRLPNEVVNGKDNMTFDIATTTINNGVADTVHTYFHVAIGGEKLPDGNKIFAATGYVPNETYLDNGWFLTDVFSDTEITYLGLYGQGTTFAGDFSTGGSLVVSANGYKQMNGSSDYGSDKGKSPVVWAIRGDYTNNSTTPLQLPYGSKLYIGRDLVINNIGIDGLNTGKSSKPVDIYVLGDMYVTGNPDFKNVNLHVAGNIYGSTSSKIKLYNKLYVNGKCEVTPNSGAPEKWGSIAGDLTVEEAKKELNRSTYTRGYRKWVINDGDPAKGLDDSKTDYIPQLDNRPGHNSAYTEITVHLNNTMSYHAASDTEAMQTVYTIAYPDSDSAKAATPEDIAKNRIAICKAGVVKEVVGAFNGYAASGVNPTIILDTGDDEDNVLTLRVNGYLERDGQKIFKWFPQQSFGSNLLIKGKGIVVIDVPEGVIYEDVSYQLTMDYNWFTFLGGKEVAWSSYVTDKNGAGSTATGTGYNCEAAKNSTKASNVIHSGCRKGDGCSYTKYNVKNPDGSDKMCETHPDEHIIGIKCATHGNTSFEECCEKCDEYGAEQAKKLVNNTHDVGVCSNRFDEPSYNSLKDSGCTGKPRINYFLVCSDESSEIRLCYHEPLSLLTTSKLTLSGGSDSISGNEFYGFIYAPFMTFKAQSGETGSGSSEFRFVGGLIVSDYAISDWRAFAIMYPEKMPNELMGESSEYARNRTDKSWKISMGGY